MARAPRKSAPKREQLQMQVDEIARRPVPVSPTERLTADGEIIGAAATPAAPTPPVQPLSEPEDEKEPFGRWLIGQVAMRRTDAIGELAKMAKSDPGFPKQGDAEEVRRRIGLAGADGDAFEALDDAEREYERL